MKKTGVCILLILILLLSGCVTEREKYFIPETDPFLTAKTGGYVYETCEPVGLYLPDEQTGKNRLAAAVSIKNVLILDSGDVRVWGDHDVFHGEALVQVNYEILKYRGEVHLSPDNILCVDSQGTPCERVEREEFEAETEYSGYKQMYFLVPVEGEYVEIQLHIGTSTDRKIIPIRCYYGVGEQEANPEELDSMKTALLMCVLVLLVLVLVIISLRRRRKQLLDTRNALQKQVEQIKNAMPQEDTVASLPTAGGADV